MSTATEDKQVKLRELPITVNVSKLAAGLLDLFTDEERKMGPQGPAAMRERVLSQAIRRGWIRLRRAPAMTPTFEVWRATDDALFRISEGIQSHGLADRGEIIRIIDHRSQHVSRRRRRRCRFSHLNTLILLRLGLDVRGSVLRLVGVILVDRILFGVGKSLVA